MQGRWSGLRSAHDRRSAYPGPAAQRHAPAGRRPADRDARTSRSSRGSGLILVAIVVVALIVAIAANKLWPLSSSTSPAAPRGRSSTCSSGSCSGRSSARMSIPARDRVHDPADAEDGPDHADRRDAHARGRLAAVDAARHDLTVYPDHGWVVASFIVVGVMAVIALGLLEPANIAVLIELKKPRPNPEVIERLMKRFIYCAGVLGVDADRDAGDHDQAGVRMNERKLPPVTQLGMASLALIVAGGIYLSAHLPDHVPLGAGGGPARRCRCCCWR